MTTPLEGTLTITGESKLDHPITFRVNNVEIMHIDEKGMTYKGVLIEDAGEAYRAFIEAMSRMNPTPRP